MLDFAPHNYASLQFQTETVIPNGGVQYHMDDSRSALLGKLTPGGREDFDILWGLDGGLAAELDIMFPGPVSAQGEEAQTHSSDNFSKDFNNDFGLEDPAWPDLHPDFRFQPDAADTDMMMTASAILA